MKKRWTALLLAAALMLSLTACGGDKQPAEEDAQEGVEETLEDTTRPEQEEDGAEAEQDTTVMDMEDLTQDQDPQIGQQPADTNEKPQTGTQPADTNEKPQGQTVTKPSTEQKPSGNQNTAQQKPAAEQKPEQKPAEQKPESAASVDLAAFAAGLTASQPDWPGMMALEGDLLDTYYAGLTALSPKQCVVQMAMISASGVEIALVEAASSADVETIKAIFQSRIDYQVGDGENPGGAWYPEPTEMWKNNSRIVSNGNYVMLVAFENADGVVDSFNALFA